MKSLKTIIFTMVITSGIFVFITNFGGMKLFEGMRGWADIAIRDKNIRTVPVIDSKELDAGVLGAMKEAHQAAYDYVYEELDKWVEELNARVNDDFLDDYFSFIETKRRELMSVYHMVINKINPTAPTPEDALLKELEDKISRKIIIPDLSQKKIANITNQAVSIYITTFNDELIKFQKSHRIPEPDWKEYIGSIGNLTAKSEANIHYPMGVKIVTVSGIALTTTVAAPVIKAVAMKVSAKLAAKKSSEVAVKAGLSTSAKVATSGAGKFASAIPFVGLGITAAVCIWDIVDYAMTSREGKIILKNALSSYFDEIRTEMLGNTENSIMGTIIEWENQLKADIENKDK